ncbi:MAG: DUF4115 domain-containing protein [Desulfobacteraceae bacterium]|nr:DUF4115 domain-containing protein [Desulfobacteraceae bacterium]
MTHIPDESIGFGSYLQAHRLDKGISLEAVSNLTRITISCLKKIECEDLDELPEPTFVKGFIKSYSETVAADKKEALALYEASYTNYLEQKRSQTQSCSEAAYLPRLLVAFFLLALIITVTLITARQIEYQGAVESISIEDRTGVTADKNQPGKPGSSGQAEQGADQTAAENEEQDNYSLKISAAEPTTIKVIIDDQVPDEYVMKAGDLLDLEAKKQFNILITNAAGVELTLNGESISVPGKSGQMVTMQLP